MLPSADTIPGLLRRAPADSMAIRAPGREPLSHAALHAWLRRAPEELAAHGIGRGTVVAMALPPGACLATAFLIITSVGAVAAPLNPQYTDAEYDFYLADLKAAALIVAAGATGPAAEVARRRGIALLELSEETPAGAFRLSGAVAAAVSADRPRAVDAALILHTSGTTSRPKQVPLTHGNLAASASNVVRSLALTATDCCLNVMPLFHIHGLVAGLLAPLGAGGQVYCPPGFNALKFFAWLQGSAATWYTAVPTMHQAILARSVRHSGASAQHSLRFIRSSSAALPPATMRALEETFGVPLIESYGMTEASHQIASNPLPPRARKPGSVGLPAGPEIRIRAYEDGWARTGEPGEIVVRGANIIGGYRSGDQANEEAFVDGWFRTGDEGYLDSDGYLFITGRIKEMINRGGEKISPREVDEVLLEHPGVAQAVTFALPDKKLGEEVAAAIVRAEGSVVDAAGLRAFARQRLAAFKVPRRVVFVEEIPVGPTGKLRRVGLAQRLGLTPCG